MTENSKYEEIIKNIFHEYFQPTCKKISFTREILDAFSEKYSIKNIGDILYTYRFRRDLPNSIQETAPHPLEWLILGSGTSNYEFRLTNTSKIKPSTHHRKIKILDATPDIIKKYSSQDEQALLAKIRYNRMIDLFLGLTCYSIQNHLRTNLPTIGQIEIDEIYVGVHKNGRHCIIPCQAKDKKDFFGIAQIIQDQEFCKLKYPNLDPILLGVQFITDKEIAMIQFSLIEEDEVFQFSIQDERHYSLVEVAYLSDQEIKNYMQ
jgi:hypothetical protein